ncbi:MAG: fibrobacter succinogenes major paralogous domain-containing protein [Bacteroidales bacterium]|nr:fibrobacter succinogenes major paralogous domain-containing protein [Bacteroidales bacterium]
MKPTFKIPGFLILIIFATLCLTSCKKDPVPPVVTTESIAGITQTTATSGGNVTDDGGAEVTARGVCWNTSENPTVSNSKTSDGAGMGTFTSSLAQLTPGTKYYVRAYATNEAGTGYGNQQSFNTGEVLLATVTTADITSPTQTSAVSGGNVTSDGGGTITARGVCWSTNQNPTVADSKTTDGSGTGSFTSNLTGLTAGTAYYVRAYATNSAGTAYGSQEDFTTPSALGAIVFNPALTYGTVSDIDGNTYKTIQIGTQTWMAENLKTTKYKDGIQIPTETDNTAWINLASPAYCWYNNDATTFKNVYGALYNWFAVQTGKLCPAGWHVPDNDEFIEFVTFLGGLSVAGGKLKETGTSHWLSPNTGATNESGFTALPGGRRSIITNGTFVTMGEIGFYWSADEDEIVYGGIGILHYNSAEIEGDAYSKPNGMSVRCIKD